MRDGLTGQTARVLLLEDDADLSAVIIDLLAGEGFEVCVCQSYTCLRKALGPGQRPVVVADFWGASQARLSDSEREQVRALGRVAPTVLLTGRAWATATCAGELNVACILSKPFMVDDLIDEVRRCFMRRGW